MPTLERTLRLLIPLVDYDLVDYDFLLRDILEATSYRYRPLFV
jgi:hypothetical protein